MKARATKSALTTRESTSRNSWRFCSHQTPGPSAQVTNSVARCLYEDFIYPLSQSITASCALNQPPFTRTTIRRCYQLAEERREILSFVAARGQAPLAGLWEDSNACLHEGIHIHGDRSCPPQQTQACRRSSPAPAPSAPARAMQGLWEEIKLFLFGAVASVQFCSMKAEQACARTTVCCELIATAHEFSTSCSRGSKKSLEG